MNLHFRLPLRRTGLVAASAVLLSTFGAGGLWSYLRTAHHELGQAVRDAVPITFELKRLEQLTQDLIPELQANKKVAAQLDVEIEYLEREVDELSTAQSDSKSQMTRLRAALDADGDGNEFGGRRFTRREIEQDLERRLTKYEDTRVRLDAKRRILAARQDTLAAAIAKINQYAHQHTLLVEKAESLQAELKLVELAQASGNFSFDHSKLQQAKTAAETVEKRIRVVRKLVEGEKVADTEIPVDTDARPVADRFDEYFAGK